METRSDFLSYVMLDAFANFVPEVRNMTVAVSGIYSSVLICFVDEPSFPKISAL
jgi:hypothetical protein